MIISLPFISTLLLPLVFASSDDTIVESSLPPNPMGPLIFNPFSKSISYITTSTSTIEIPSSPNSTTRAIGDSPSQTSKSLHEKSPKTSEPGSPSNDSPVVFTFSKEQVPVAKKQEPPKVIPLNTLPVPPTHSSPSSCTDVPTRSSQSTSYIMRNSEDAAKGLDKNGLRARRPFAKNMRPRFKCKCIIL